MKISDELRKVADEYDVLPLYGLTDRIDREMLELPHDRDGVSIHAGDTVWLEDGRKAEVYRIELTKGMETIVCRVDFINVVRILVKLASTLTHERPDSWERVANELEEWSEDNRVNGDHEVFNRARDFSERVRKLAAKGER